MANLSESVQDKSNSSRGLNTAVISSQSSRLLTGNRTVFSGDTSDNWRCLFRKSDPQQVRPSWGDLNDNPLRFSGACEDEMEEGRAFCGVEQGDVSLRRWLDEPSRSVDLLECLHIFKQIVEIVNLAHSQGVVFHNVRPSCFVLSSSNHVSFIESASCSSSGSDSYDNDFNQHRSPSPLDLHQQQSRLVTEDYPAEISGSGTSRVASVTGSLQLSSSFASRQLIVEENKLTNRRKIEAKERKKTFPLKQILLMEINWYCSPEEDEGAPSSFCSDVYRLGVLLFEVCSYNVPFFQR